MQEILIMMHSVLKLKKRLKMCDNFFQCSALVLKVFLLFFLWLKISRYCRTGEAKFNHTVNINYIYIMA